MAKSRRKKNYKLRKRVMRTVAALTMIMAIVVAAIPVENYGTMRAAVLEREPWDKGDNAYPTDEKKLFGTSMIFPDSQYGTPRTLQEVRGGYLSNIVSAVAVNTGFGAEAILKDFLSTTGDTSLDVREYMYYDYKTYKITEIDDWINGLQEPGGDKEYFQVSFRTIDGREVRFTKEDGTPDSITLPITFNLSDPVFRKENEIEGSIGGFDTNKSSFGMEEVFSGENAFFKSQYNGENGYVDRVTAYNDAVGELATFEGTTDAEWDTYKANVRSIQEWYDGQFAPSMADESLKVEINSDLDNREFYLQSFCDRVKCNDPSMFLKGFRLERCVDSSSAGSTGSTEGNEVYVVKWNEDSRDALGENAQFVDDNGYLAKGRVKIVGVRQGAFENSQITDLTLPNTIKGIGDNAFENSAITNLQFNPRNCEKIGNKAFYNCNRLESINLTNSGAEGSDANLAELKSIGYEAFYGTGIKEIVFPNKLTEIGDGCFAESALTHVDFSGVRSDLTVGQYAFFNCNLNQGVVFPTSKVTIDKAAFAVSYNTDDANGNPMETFVFPNNMSMKGDYILAGRTHLRNVTLPGSLSEKVEEGTFRNCERLSCVTLGELSYNGDKGSNIKLEGNIFQDVENTAFYVQGPGYKSDGKTPTASRENAIKLLYGLTIKDGGINVPYKFLIDDNTTQHIEQIQGNVIVEIRAIDESTAQIVRYRKNGEGSVSTVVVGDDIAGYHITSLGAGCFDGIRNDLTELVIRDGGFLTEIGDNALNGASMLERVTIGNSVTSIGANAFANCSKLKDVYFSQPLVSGDDWSQALAIAQGAFRTNSDKLTFHGVVRNNYAPFVYAMDGATAGFTNESSGKNICYQSLVEIPGELREKINSSEISVENRKNVNEQIDELQESGGIKLIRDNGEGLVTLIDYPHVDKMSDDVKTVISNYVIGDVDGQKKQINEEQARLLNAALNIEIPEGVQSIDTKSYFDNNNNADNKIYITGSVGGKNLSSLYAEDGTAGGEDYIGGLFSGYFSEAGQGLISRYVSGRAEELGIMPLDGQVNLKQDGYVEDVIRGNDHLTSITLSSTITTLPEEYAFDSCENLTSVTLGSGVMDIGKLPFRGCKSLENVVGNGYYVCENGILYGKSSNAEDGEFDHIVECLETRGNGTTSWIVKTSIDSNLKNVTSISPGAFSNCEHLVTVDFTGTKLEQIPENCFRGSSQIQEIILPDSIRSVQKGAFVTDKSTGAIDIWVYNPNCDLDANAFDSKTRYTIHAYEFTDNTNTTPTYVNNFCQTHPNIEFEPIEPGWTVRFRDTRDGSIIESITGLETGANINTLPDMDAYLTEHPYEGFAFDGWLWTDSDGVQHSGREAYSDIREDRELYAQFKPADYNFTGEDVTVNIVGGTLQGSGTINEDGTSIVIPSGSQIAISANESATQAFNRWSVSDDLGERWFGVDGDGVYNARTMFRVPNPPESGTITITANFWSQDRDTYTVTVNNGIGGGAYRPGEVVTVTAYAAETGQNFDKWTTTTPGVAFSDASTVTTTFIMPASNVEVTANYKAGGSSAGETYTVTVGNGSGGGSYRPGATVTIIANAAQTGQTFVNWTTTTAGVTLANANAATTTFVMPASNVVVTANYNTNGGNNNQNYTVTVNNGTGGGQFAQGATVTITANKPNEGASFVNWTTTTSGVTFASATSATTTFTMPASNVTVTANFSDGTGGQPSGGGSTEKKYKVTVNYGSGSGEYAAGATVNITANAPESSSRVFSRWTTSNSGLGFANANAVSTSFVMPAADVTVTANYKTRSSSDDDDDDDRSPSRRPGTNTNTTTVDNRPGSSTSTTTSTTGTVSNPASGTSSTNTTSAPNNNNGNRIYITKNGISNTDVASLAVNGSTDNFIVRITESPDATAAVEQALTNTYGSLNGLAYLPMDISLYDSTGQNKISDTTGLNITVTMPIPDVLIQYGGNARVAAADNGALQQITPRFTTIDGIACVSFVPQHFSPYVIYVDTNNLIAGQMYDTTPATGDPIHPKWFAAIGMACVSILLFVMSDGRKRKKYRAA